jgi:hypothetical protein
MHNVALGTQLGNIADLRIDRRKEKPRVCHGAVAHIRRAVIPRKADARVH